MSHEERNNIASLIAGLLINIYVIIKLSNMFEAGRLDGPDAMMIWARAMLWVIPIGILTVIVCIIVFSILFAIAERDGSPSFVVDERDEAIKTFGMRFTMVATSVGFIGGLIALAMGTAPLFVFIGMFFAFSVGDLIGNAAKLIRYRAEV